jgi:hypothetical protein
MILVLHPDGTVSPRPVPPSPMVFPVLIFSGCDSKRSLNSISRKSPIVTSMGKYTIRGSYFAGVIGAL